MDCASCKQNIDDDSLYCDQCGVEVLKCSACGRIGKGKRCIFCGKPLIAARLEPAGTAIGGAAAAGSSDSGAPKPRAVGVLTLVNATCAIHIEPKDGDILGRKFGAYVEMLGRFSQISSQHLKICRKTDGSWFVIDLMSFNHSFYNGAQLAPHTEQQIFDGGRLALADMELKVSIV